MLSKTKKPTEEAFREALVMVAPGTVIREALEAIIQSDTGALICIGSFRRLTNLSEGGVQLDAAVTPQLLYELSKMDGAIILDETASRIHYANRFLKPDAKLHSEETGTRHRTAQRLAHQAECTVIAVSKRRSSVTLYVHDRRYVLDSISDLVNKAMQAIATLEKYLNVLRQTMHELTIREFQDVVTIFDVCKTIQRTEMVVRIAKEIYPYLLELGTEGRLIELQLKELLIPIEEARLVIKDYWKEKPGTTYEAIVERVSAISSQDLLTLGNISLALGYGSNLRAIDTYLSPRGYRVLTATHRLPSAIIDSLVGSFGSLQKIIRAPKEELVDVEGVGEILAERIRVSLNLLRNQLVLDDRR